MSTEANDVARRARSARRAGAIGLVVAASSHSSLGAHTVPAVSIAGGLFVAAAGVAVTAEAQGFPVELIWITGALTGTIAGAVAAVLVSLIVSPKAQARHHLLRLALAFIGGLAIAPFALGYAPHPQSLPLAFHIFGMSALCAFGAPALAIALHKRSDAIATDLILTAGDKVHKAVHPSRWGEGKPCECGKMTRGDCGKLYGPDCVATKSEMGL